MRYLFIVTELPFPANRNGLSLINYELLTRAPVGVVIDLLVAEQEDRPAEEALRRIAPQLDRVVYAGDSYSRLFRIGNLLTGAASGRCLFERPAARRYLDRSQGNYDAIYVAPLMTFVNPVKMDRVLLNAVDSFARLNETAYRRHGRLGDLIKSRLYGSYERKVLSHVDVASFVSSADVEYVLRCNPDCRIICNPNGIDTEYFSVGRAKRERFSVLFTGNFSYGPNREAAVFFAQEVLPLLVAREPRARFYVVGRNPPPGIERIPGVVVTGYVHDIREYYWQCEVFACPLWRGAGIKNKVLEAMACGVPVVCTPLSVDGIEGVVADLHFLLAEAPAQFAARILELWRDRSKAEKIACEARSSVSGRLGWAHVADDYFKWLAITADRGKPAKDQQ